MIYHKFRIVPWIEVLLTVDQIRSIGILHVNVTMQFGTCRQVRRCDTFGGSTVFNIQLRAELSSCKTIQTDQNLDVTLSKYHAEATRASGARRSIQTHKRYGIYKLKFFIK